MNRASATAFLLLCGPVYACIDEPVGPDAYGNFEARAVTISAEARGRLLSFVALEGTELKAGQTVAQIEATGLELQKAQLTAQLESLDSQLTDASIEISVLENERAVLLRERRRLAQLVAAKAATSKAFDDVAGRVEVLERRIQAVRRGANSKNTAILSQRAPLRANIDSIQDQIDRCTVVNPVTGTVLTQLVEPHELVNYGTPLFRIANLHQLELRAYVAAPQLSGLAIGQMVTVLIDGSVPNERQVSGTITWISPEAEFTPKTIQTKDERSTLVYAIKISVENEDGTLKDGMPAEVLFSSAKAN